MKNIFSLVISLLISNTYAQQNLWKDYFSYNNVRCIDITSQKTYFATENSVIVYNDLTNEKTIYNSVNNLKIESITSIAYNAIHNKIIVGNALGNIAIIDLANHKTNYLNDISNKTSLADNEKVIHKIITKESVAYVATGYGISEIDLRNNHFGDSYYIGNNGENVNVKDITLWNNDIVALLENEGLKKISLNQNLADFSIWQTINSDPWDNIDVIDGKLLGYQYEHLYAFNSDLSINQIPIVFENSLKDLKVYDQKISLTFDNRVVVLDNNYNIVSTHNSDDTFQNFTSSVHKGNFVFVASNTNGLMEIDDREIISPNGPYSNNIFNVALSNSNAIWLTYGGYDYDYNPYALEGGIQKKPFSVLQNNNWQTVNYNRFNVESNASIGFDPRNKDVAYISSFHNGLLKINNITQHSNLFTFEHYNAQNSPFPSIANTNYTRVLGPVFDSNGHGWITSSRTVPNLIRFDKDLNFQSYTIDNNTENNYLAPAIDKNGTKWIASSHGGIIAFNEKNNRLLNITTSNSNLPSNRIRKATLDLDQQLWIGTDSGLRVIPNTNQFMNANVVNVNNIVIMDDGTAEELFYQQNILDILVDGSNNKWVSIENAGVFYISNNGKETYNNFNTENSPLPSNNIHTISMNKETGEIFFASNKGMVSYTNVTSSEGQDSYDNIIVFPNPVRPGFNGDVKISGLIADSVIKITDASGNLVYETTAKGGTATWNTYSFSGNKVGSGVYMIFISNTDGSETATKKLMIIR